VICEALHFCKPILCFPIAKAYGQFCIAYNVSKLVKRDCSTVAAPELSLFENFGTQIERLKNNKKTMISQTLKVSQSSSNNLS
jgi:hypothetical protein